MDTSDNRYDDFVRLYSHHEPHIRAFLRSLLPTWQDVDEVIQEVSIIIWKKFDKFDTSTDFMRWVCVIARLETLKYRRKHARSRLVFTDELYTLMADEGHEELENRQQEFNALKSCLAGLPENHRSFVNLVYEEGTKTVDLAQQMNTTVSSLYMKMTRIRKSLFKCIKQKVQVAQ
jgi:RNA polymerase sigma-70 factor, ECF subfamily